MRDAHLQKLTQVLLELGELIDDDTRPDDVAGWHMNVAWDQLNYVMSMWIRAQLSSMEVGEQK